MLKRMRWRVIAASAGAVSVLLAALLLVINMGSYYIMTRRQDEILQRTSAEYMQGDERWQIFAGNMSDAEIPELFPYEWGQTSFEAGESETAEGDWELETMSDSIRPILQPSYISLLCTVVYDSEGNVMEIWNDSFSSITDEEARDYAGQIRKTGRHSGYYGSYRYLIQTKNNEIWVSFINCAAELRSTRTVMIVSCTVGLCFFLTFFLLIFFFSGKAVAPYICNSEKQKRFITDAGHELKTPLTSIAASTEILSMIYGPNEWIENIQRQIERLTRLIQNMVTLSRMDEELPFPSKEEFSLSNLVWEVTEGYAAMAETENKILISEIKEDIAYCGDEGAIRQMLSLLLDNALKYSEQESRIYLKLTRNRKDIVLLVKNSCDVRSLGDLDLLFDRFYRPDDSRTSQTGGSGVGLSIVRSVVQAHGGKVSASAEGTEQIIFEVIL